jgi:ATP-dependent Clp protease ATP-binding subunit ClpC
MVNEDIARYADIFTALGSEPRLEIMRLLFAAHPNGMTVGDLQVQLKIPNSTLSHHLEKLRVEGLVSVRRERQFLWYSANAVTVENLLSFLYNGCSIGNHKSSLAANCTPHPYGVEQVVESASHPSKEKEFMFEGFLKSIGSLFGGIVDKFYLPSGFERFTQKAIQAISLAQDESRRLKHAYVGTEQILLGLLAEGTGIAAQVLTATGVNLEAAQLEIEKKIGHGRGTPAEIPFTPRAKRALELTVEQAQQLGHHSIGTEHLLLGVLREGQGLAVRVLENLGVNPQNLEQQLRAAMNS